MSKVIVNNKEMGREGQPRNPHNTAEQYEYEIQNIEKHADKVRNSSRTKVHTARGAKATT